MTLIFTTAGPRLAAIEPKLANIDAFDALVAELPISGPGRVIAEKWEDNDRCPAEGRTASQA